MMQLVPNGARSTARTARTTTDRIFASLALGLQVLVCCALTLAAAAEVSAQNLAPPPGFSPGEDDSDSSVPPEPRILPRKGGYLDSDRDSKLDSDEDSFPNFSPLPPSRGPLTQQSLGPDPVTVGPVSPFGPILLPVEVMPMPRVWFRAEALYWWTKANPLPVPVVTTGSFSDPIPGALGQPGTSILIGDQNISMSGRGGSRFTLGFALDPEQVWGLEGTYFNLATATTSVGVTSDGSSNSALLTFPFFDPTIPGENSSPLALPGQFAGTAVVTVQTFLQGAELNAIRNLQTANGFRFDVLGGFRYVNLKENLNFTTDSPNVAPNPPAFFNTFDQFDTNNNFYGGQIGLRASYDNLRWFMNTTGKLAIGETLETVSVNGGTFTDFNGPFQSAPGGYLSQPSNIGSMTKGQFAVVPEFNMNLGVRLRPWVSLMVGYSFLYISSVARPGDQIDRVINPTQSSAISNNFPANLSGPARPELNVQSASFWAQGLNFSLEFRY